VVSPHVSLDEAVLASSARLDVLILSVLPCSQEELILLRTPADVKNLVTGGWVCYSIHTGSQGMTATA